MKFNRYYITNTLEYEAMIHHLFFLWIIKTNCDCAHLNWKKAINLIIRMQNVGGGSYHIYPCCTSVDCSSFTLLPHTVQDGEKFGVKLLKLGI